MTNIHALYVFLVAIGSAILIGQSGYLSPTGGLVDGFQILTQETITTVVGWIGDGSLWIFNTVWLMETMKNVFQAALFAGAALVGIFTNNASEAQKMTNQATVAGFLVFVVLMAMATKRIESLRSIVPILKKD
jgi:hypothetical protein